ELGDLPRFWTALHRWQLRYVLGISSRCGSTYLRFSTKQCRPPTLFCIVSHPLRAWGIEGGRVSEARRRVGRPTPDRGLDPSFASALHAVVLLMFMKPPTGRIRLTGFLTLTHS